MFNKVLTYLLTYWK